MKTHPDELAIFGAQPVFDQPLHVGRPEVGDRDALMTRIEDILDRRWFTNDGPYVRQLEQRIADYVGARNCVAVCNGTVGLEIASRALGLAGEVIVPAFTFVATVHALTWQGITPVFCEIDPQTHNLSPAAVEAAVTPSTTGVVGVHVWGRPCSVDELTNIANRHRLKLLFDSAHAFGCSHGGQMIGTFGDAEVFSFHATKFVHAFEGGAIVTNDDELAETMRLMRNFGFAGYDNVIHLGVNGKMSEVSAAMAITAIDDIDRLISQNRENYEEYRKGLQGAPGYRLVEYSTKDRRNYQYVVVEVSERDTGISRDIALQILHAENVLARRYFFPGCHRMGPYLAADGTPRARLPATDAVCENVLVLPTGGQMTPAEIDGVCSILRLASEHSTAIVGRLEHGVRTTG